MTDNNIKEYDFTDAAWESLYDGVDDTRFKDQDARVIYNTLRQRLKCISFGEYLQRYIYLKAELEQPFSLVSLKEYQLIIRTSFSDRHTPPSFGPTTAKLSALSKNWLTRQTVKRNVVFLLGFGLDMSVEDVNLFLTKGLREAEINPKNPFEVICWYCYKNHYNYLKFSQLWEKYLQIPANDPVVDALFHEHTIRMRGSVSRILDDDSLMAYVSRLKTSGNQSLMSVTAKECFLHLYNEARTVIAQIYNREEAEAPTSKKRVFTPEEITESHMEQIICSAIPKDRHGNLTPGKASQLNRQFSGKRFSRQRIHEILAGEAEVTRFELITLNFFIFSQRLDMYPDARERYFRFQESTDEILEKCCMGQLYIQNPYECFVLMCLLSQDPLGTYADVWELSYEPGTVSGEKG